MPEFTIEMTFRVPHYRHTTYEAATLEEAIAMARADDDWENQEEDFDTCGAEYITGAWEGDEAYSGDCMFSEEETLPALIPATPSPDLHAAMLQIQALLSGKEWDSGTMSDVAEIVRNAGYEIKDTETEEA